MRNSTKPRKPSLPSRPTKPKPPNSTIEQTRWVYSTNLNVSLRELVTKLVKVADFRSVDELLEELAKYTVSTDHDSYSIDVSVTEFVPNPRFSQLQQQYENRWAVYEKKMAVYEARMREYEARKAEYEAHQQAENRQRELALLEKLKAKYECT